MGLRDRGDPVSADGAGPLLIVNRDVLPALRCRFGCDGPVGIFYVPAGCVCWTDPIQALCEQHVITAESCGPIDFILDLSEVASVTKVPEKPRL
jgi:hypothetical protein